jgi:two-component system, NtrC family, sensor kinase
VHLLPGESRHLLVTGRSVESRPFAPPIDTEDVASLRAVARMVTALVQTNRIAALRAEEAQRHIEAIESARQLELARKEREIERLRNVELTEAMRRLRETQMQLVHAEKMAGLGQLTAGIAHEINNPINFIVTALSPLSRDLHSLASIDSSGDEEERREIIEEATELIGAIREGALRTAAIVRSLRSFSRLDEDELKPVDLHEGIDATLSLLVHRLDGINVRRHYGEVPPVECRPGQINQVWLHLMNNAIDAIETKGRALETKGRADEGTTGREEVQVGWDDGMSGSNDLDGRGGEIVVTTRVEGETVLVEIEDNGCGIESGIVARVFEPFFTTRDVGEGAGLGLSVSLGIVEGHGGELTLEPVTSGGTRARVTLPLAPDRS